MVLQDLLDRTQRLREHIAQDFLQTARGAVYLRRHTKTIDRFVVGLAKICQLPSQVAIVALGGYGRAEMFPYSDVDILILHEPNPSETLTEAISQFVTHLWDLKLTVGSSVRTTEELLSLAKTDITVATAFLEARFIWGNSQLFETTRTDFRANLRPLEFFTQKMLELRQRHQRYADTPYALEPNIKESPGGIRDLQVYLWCTQCAGLGKDWKELAKIGLISATQAYHLRQNHDDLRDLRIRLHLLRNRHEDRLLFDTQRELAAQLGLKDKNGLLASEQLMRRYYLKAKSTLQLQEIVLASMLEHLHHLPSVNPLADGAPIGSTLDTTLANPERANLLVPAASGPLAEQGPTRIIDSVFIQRGDTLDIVSKEAFLSNSKNVLLAFVHLSTHLELKRMSTRLLSELWDQQFHMNRSCSEDPTNKALFINMLKQHYGPYHFLKSLNAWGVLGRFLPVWRRIVGQMQHDLFHAYTVDQHTLRVVKFLRRFSHSAYAHEYPLCSQIISEMNDPWRLTVAGLFHDIAKGRQGDHSILGAKEVRKFCKDFGLDNDVADFCAFLVQNHLVMSHTAQKRDITNPEVIRQFAEIVGTQERLDALFLLTIADIRATSPKVWNNWKQQLLTTLYQSTSAILAPGSSAPTQASITAQRRQQACQLISEMGIPNVVRDNFWKVLDIVYFMRHDPENIAWHTKELAFAPSIQVPIVRVRMIANDTLEVLVYTPDQPALFARVVSQFERLNLSVVDARIHTTLHGYALDTFRVQAGKMRDLDESLQQKIVTRLSQALEKQSALPPAKRGKLSRRSRSFPVTPRVFLERAEGQRQWLLQITCNDRVGLLYGMALVFMQYDITLETAKIATLDERVEDVFLLRSHAFDSAEQVVEIEKALLQVALNYD